MTLQEQLEKLYSIQTMMREVQESGLWEPLHDSKHKVIKLIQELESKKTVRLSSRELAIKEATPQELLQNDSVRELVDKLQAYNEYFNELDKGNYSKTRPSIRVFEKVLLNEGIEALKKFEVKE